MAEWFKAAVLKTVGSETGPGVRIPLSPPAFARFPRASARPTLWVGLLVAVLATASLNAQANLEKLKDPSQLTEQSPAQYRARFDTSKGVFVIDVNREWAPVGADRFYNLVKNGFYDENRFFRVISGFMVQFGINGNPQV